MHEAHGVLEHFLLVIAIAFGTINIVGGFLVTDRMLGMFGRKPDLPESPPPDELVRRPQAVCEQHHIRSAGGVTHLDLPISASPFLSGLARRQLPTPSGLSLDLDGRVGPLLAAHGRPSVG